MPLIAWLPPVVIGIEACGAHDWVRRFRAQGHPVKLMAPIKDSAVPIHGPPQIVVLTTNGEKNLVQMPGVTGLRTVAAELMSILSAKLPAPFADRLTHLLNKLITPKILKLGG